MCHLYSRYFSVFIHKCVFRLNVNVFTLRYFYFTLELFCYFNYISYMWVFTTGN